MNIENGTKLVKEGKKQLDDEEIPNSTTGCNNVNLSKLESTTSLKSDKQE